MPLAEVPVAAPGSVARSRPSLRAARALPNRRRRRRSFEELPRPACRGGPLGPTVLQANGRSLLEEGSTSDRPAATVPGDAAWPIASLVV
ncbi:MAG: hypothetical protein ACLTDR_05815 [Adlercreutzia equolifaciens]